MARATLGEYLATRQKAKKQERRVHAALAACLAGVLLGLYAGVVAKNSEHVQQTEWNFGQRAVAEGHSADYVTR
jgi:hypothetical protein